MNESVPPGLRWAILGASAIAQARVVPALRARGQSVVVVHSRSSERAEQWSARNGVDEHTTALESALDRTDVDAVFISATNDRHRELAERAAAAGKHVLCEKPLADNLADAEAIIEACRRAGVVLAANHHLPGAATHRTMRELVGVGAIGAVRAVRITHAGLLPPEYHRWRLGDSQGAGVVLDVTSHAASAANALLAPRRASDVVSLALRQGDWEVAGSAEDAAAAVIRYDTVLVQTFDAYTTAHAESGIEIFGSQGSIRGIDVLSQDPRGQVILSDARGTREVETGPRQNLYETVIEQFVAAVGGTGAPTVTGDDALQALRIALAVRQAAATGERVTLDGSDSPPHDGVGRAIDKKIE